MKKFEHDCDVCIFLGHSNDCDLYICAKSYDQQGSLVSRYGNEDHLYASCPVFIVRTHKVALRNFSAPIAELRRAYEIAKERGLIK